MTTLSSEALAVLGTHVLVASTPSNLWRKLSQSSSVEALSRGNSTEALQQDLHAFLSAASLSPDEYTLAYCLLVALLLHGPEGVHRAESLSRELTDRLPLAGGMIAMTKGQSSTGYVRPPLRPSGPSLDVANENRKLLLPAAGYRPSGANSVPVVGRMEG